MIPRSIANVFKPPPCEEFIFAIAQGRCFEARYKGDADPRDGTSCDHFISKQAGFIPQVSGKLTNTRFHGSTAFDDHSTRCVHASLF